MEYRQLGNSGLKVPVLSFGTGTFGGRGDFFKAWGNSDVGEAMRALTTFDVRRACDVLRPVYDATATGILLPARPYASGTA